MSAFRFHNGNDYALREVPVDVLREAFQRSGISAGELARRLGWMRPDSGRVHRQLGVSIQYDGHTRTSRRRQTVSPGRALEIIEALGLDPVDFDL